MRSGSERRRNRKRNRRVAVRREGNVSGYDPGRAVGLIVTLQHEEIGRARVNQNLRSLDNWISGTNLRRH